MMYDQVMSTELEIGYLIPGEHYRFYVVASNRYMSSARSAVEDLTFLTYPESP